MLNLDYTACISWLKLPLQAVAAGFRAEAPELSGPFHYMIVARP